MTKVEKDKGSAYVFPDERRQLVAQSGYLVTKRKSGLVFQAACIKKTALLRGQRLCAARLKETNPSPKKEELFHTLFSF
jgi:hypothetical protein